MKQSERRVLNKQGGLCSVVLAVSIMGLPMCRADEIDSIQDEIGAIHVATSITRLDPVKDLEFLSSEENRYQITIEDGFGYAEHLVIGYFLSPDGLGLNPIAFFQSWNYDPETKETRATAG